MNMIEWILKFLLLVPLFGMIVPDGGGGGDGENETPDFTPDDFKDITREIVGEEVEGLPAGELNPDGTRKIAEGSGDADLGLPPDDIIFPDEEKPSASDKPGDEIDKISSESIKLEDYPEAARGNVGNLRKKIQRDEAVFAALEQAGITVEHAEDGTVRVNAPAGGNEVKELQAKLLEKEDKIGRLSLVETEGFQKEYVQPITQQLNVIYQTALSLAGDQAQTDEQKKLIEQSVIQLAQLPPHQRIAAIQKSNPENAATIIPMFAQIDIMADRRNKAVQQWKETQKELGERETAETMFKTKAIKEQLRQQTVQKLAQQGYFMLKKSTGTDDRSVKWNKSVDAVNQSISTFFDDPDPAVAAEAFVRAAASEYLLGVTKSLQKKNQDLMKRLQAYGDVSADIGSGGGGDRGRLSDIPAEMTPEEAAEKILTRIA